MNIPIIRPNVNRYLDSLIPELREILSSNMLTNVNNITKRFEDSIKRLLGTRNVIAVSSATSGLMLVLEALGVRGKEVVLPSFTFAATAASAYWTSNKLVFADIDDTFTIDPAKVIEKVNDRTGAILAVHMYGNPVHINRLKEISEETGIPLIIDAAHAIGASYHGKKCGSLGIPEVFSLSPTKLITSVEGGIITTDDDELAEKLRIMRNYGLDKNYESEIPGLNARMSEVHAAIGLSQINDVQKFVTNRNEYVMQYKKELNGIPGLSFQNIPTGHISSHKDFSIIINKNQFGMDRDKLGIELTELGIGVKKYFYPPVHRLKAYKDDMAELPVTNHISNNVLSLPIYNYMDKENIEFISRTIMERCRK